MLAERALIDRKTLRKVERGDPGTSLGVYATVLFVLGMADRLERLADPATDALGIDLSTDDLPKRVRTPRGSR